jgi:hypothetical protein
VWRNWQPRWFEKPVEKSVQVRLLSLTPFLTVKSDVLLLAEAYTKIHRENTEMLKDDWFWAIVAQAEADPEKLNSILQTLSIQEVVMFRRYFRTAYNDLEKVDKASGVRDFHIDTRVGVIAQGKELFEKAVTCGNFNSDLKEWYKYENETYNYIAPRILQAHGISAAVRPLPSMGGDPHDRFVDLL